MKEKTISFPRNLTEFKSNYYYKKELIQLCRQKNLPSFGTKAELNSYIEKYLRGVPAHKIVSNRKSERHKPLTYKQITLKTKVVNSGFSFNEAARQFFAEYFGVKKFSFKKKMAIIKRKAEAENDTAMTVQDLLDLYSKANNDLILQSSEETTYQWNNFVSDFNNDPSTKEFKQKMKVASILWHHVKNSSNKKKYSHSLLNLYQNEIQKYKE